MNQVASEIDQFWKNMTRTGGNLIERVPTFDGGIESYFEENIDLIMDEWGLVTGGDLDIIGRKIDFLSYEVNRLVAERSTVQKRIENLKSSISDLEEKL